MASGDDGWTVRIGADAAELHRQAVRWRRTFVLFLLVFVVLEIAFQVASSRLGVAGAVVPLFVALAAAVISLRRDAQARRSAATRLGIAGRDSRWVPFREGPSGYDRWLSARW